MKGSHSLDPIGVDFPSEKTSITSILNPRDTWWLKGALPGQLPNALLGSSGLAWTHSCFCSSPPWSYGKHRSDAGWNPDFGSSVLFKSTCRAYLTICSTIQILNALQLAHPNPRQPCFRRAGRAMQPWFHLPVCILSWRRHFKAEWPCIARGYLRFRSVSTNTMQMIHILI